MKQPRNFQEQRFNKLLWNSFTINSSRTFDNLYTLDNFSFTLDNDSHRFNRTLENDVKTGKNTEGR